MEVTIEEIQGIENDSIVSIRAGSTRRQAPISQKQAFSFPSLPLNANPFKIDVLRPVCSQRVRINASQPQAEEAYDVKFPSKDGTTMSMRVKVKESPQMCGTTSARAGGEAAPPQETDAVPALEMDLTQRKAEAAAAARSAAESYLERFKLLKFVQEMLQYIIREKPEDPYCWMSEYLRKFDTKTPAQPAPKTEEMTNLIRKDAKSQLLSASLDGRLESVFKKLNPPKEKPPPPYKQVPRKPFAFNPSVGTWLSPLPKPDPEPIPETLLRGAPFTMNPSVGTWLSPRSFRADREDATKQAAPEGAGPWDRTPQSFWDGQYSKFPPAPGSPQKSNELKKKTQPGNPDWRKAPDYVFTSLHSQFNPAPGSPQAKRAEPASSPPAEAAKATEPAFQSRELPFQLFAAAPDEKSKPEEKSKPGTEDQVITWMTRQNDRLDEENERIRKEIVQLQQFVQEKGITSLMNPCAEESLATLRTTGALEGVIRAEHEELAGKNRQLRSEHEALRNTLSEFCLGLSDLAKGLAQSVAPPKEANGQPAPGADGVQVVEDSVVAENARLEAENQALMKQIQELQT